jgi:erythromycin esterase
MAVRILAFILFLLFQSSHLVAQVSFNADFEQLDYTGKKPRNWIIVDPTYFSMEADSSDKLAGRYSLHVTTKDNAPKTANVLILNSFNLDQFPRIWKIDVSYAVRILKGDRSRLKSFIGLRGCTPYAANVTRNVASQTNNWSQPYADTNWLRLEVSTTLNEVSCKFLQVGFQVFHDIEVLVDSISIRFDSNPIINLPLPELPRYGEKEVKVLEENSIPLNNYSFLRSAVGNASIVALGESTHGTSEFFRVRNDVIQYMVDSMGFDIIAFENSFTPTWKVNSLFGKVPSKKIIDSLFGRIHETDEMTELFDWVLRKGMGGRDLLIAGFDNYGFYASMELLMDTLMKTDPGLYQMMYGLNQYRLTTKYSAGKNDTLYKMSQDIHTALLAKKGNRNTSWLEQYLKVMMNAFRLEYLRALTVRIENPPGYMNFRDSVMALNVSWLKQQYPDKKIIVIAHNGHIAKGEPAKYLMKPMGSFLKEKWGKSFVSFSFLTARGKVTSYNNQGEPSINSLHEPAPDCYEYYFSQVKYPSFFFKTPSSTSPVLTDLKCRSLGYGFSETTNHFFPINLKENCDGVFFIRETNGARSYYLK